MTETLPKGGIEPQAIIIAGTFADGFDFVGPFATPADAHAYIDRQKIAHATVAELSAPDNRAAFAMMACRMLIYGDEDTAPGTDACIRQAADLARLALRS